MMCVCAGVYAMQAGMCRRVGAGVQVLFGSAMCAGMVCYADIHERAVCAMQCYACKYGQKSMENDGKWQAKPAK